MASKREILTPEGYFHVYNRANGDDRLFTQEHEYNMFIEKYFRTSMLIFTTYGFCLIPNHFHFLVKVHDQIELDRRIGVFADEKSRSNFMAQHMGNFFNWYATYFNKEHDRKGSLFIHSFQRKPINDDQYLRTVILYIHANPVKAGLCKNLDDWKYSSYKEYLGKSSYITGQNKNMIINKFDNLINFTTSHRLYLEAPHEL